MTELNGRMSGQFWQRLETPNDSSKGLDALAKVKNPELNLTEALNCGLHKTIKRQIAQPPFERGYLA
jgi:hypothetical protein